MRDRNEKHSILPIHHTANSKEHGILAALEAVKDFNSSKLTMEELSNQIAIRIRTTLKASCVSLWLAHDQQNFITLQAFSSIDSPDSDPKKYSISVEESSPVADCFLAGRSCIHKKHPLAENDPRAGALTSTYCSVVLPLLTFGKVFGVFEILTASNNPINNSELESLEMISSQISLLLSNYQIFAKVERQSELQNHLYEITAKIAKAKDVESILKITIEELCAALNLPGASIRLNLTASSPVDELNPSSKQEVTL